MTIRGVVMWVHFGLGVTAALVLAIVSLTGAYITFQKPLERWLTPVPTVEPFTGQADLPAVAAAVQRRYTANIADIDVAADNRATVARLRDRTLVFLDPSDNSIVGVRDVSFASLPNLTAVMRRLHGGLMLGPRGRMIVSLATFEAMLLALTGLWLWWRKKHWRLGPWRGSVFRVSWDLHSATGIWFLVPLLAMGITGLLLAMPGPVYRSSGVEPAPYLNPPRSQMVESGTSIDLPRALASAAEVRPGERLMGVSIPGIPTGVFGVRTSRETVFVDQYDGRVIEVRPLRTPTAADHALDQVELAHTGELWGIPGQTVMTLGTLMLFIMTVTGVVLGWKRVAILLKKQVND